jgi:hypothetical protein
MAYVGYYKQFHTFLFFLYPTQTECAQKKVPRIAISVVSVSRVPGVVEHAVPKQRIPQ